MQNWDDLKFVMHTARHGGTSGAARALGVNHATVARRISAAEAALGTRLFDRLPSGYVPTEAGWEAVEAAEAMARLNQDLDRRITARDTAISGPLKVTAPELLIARVLAPIVADFLHTHPDVELSLVATNATLNLAQRDADVAIRFAKSPPDTLVGRQLFEQKGAVFAHRDLIARDPGGTAPLDWIRFAHWPGPPKEIKDIRPNLVPRLTVDDMAAAVGAVRAQIGATRMACFLGDSDPLLARVPGLPLFSQAPLWVLTHADLRQVPRVRIFTEFVTTRLKALQPLFEGQTPASP
ncbi:LysR family transcriptional regulator [Shimia sp. R11_0]|uniref:LysR family transcriptional regulator n=1 Tax=Shimia sp. R11_0 TaxID=2821096 RepID=UPI001ADD3DB8|nr:LysR family transcriptional regulator [Shimia sp. R11_0]MBO9476516.1 LysR family transcriptional regulator [Shimia sp. R11_0]